MPEHNELSSEEDDEIVFNSQQSSNSGVIEHIDGTFDGADGVLVTVHAQEDKFDSEVESDDDEHETQFLFNGF